MPPPKKSFVEYKRAPKHSLQAGERIFSVQNSADSSNSFIGSASCDSHHHCLRLIAEIRFPKSLQDGQQILVLRDANPTLFVPGQEHKLCVWYVAQILVTQFRKHQIKVCKKDNSNYRFDRMPKVKKYTFANSEFSGPQPHNIPWVLASQRNN